MRDGIISGDVFDFGVGDAAVVFEERGQVSASDITALVDRGGQYRAPVLTIPDWVVGPPAEE